MSYDNGNLPSLGTYVGTKLRMGQVFAGGEYDQAINYLVSPPAYVNNNSPFGYSNGAPGAEMSPFFTYAIQPAALNNQCITAAAVLSSGGYLPITGSNQPGATLFNLNGQAAIQFDCARNVSLLRVGTTGSPNVYVWGYDYGNVPMFEQINFASSATTAVGKKAFLIVSAIYVSNADTWSAGAGNTFGLPYFANDFGNLGYLAWNGVDYYQSGLLSFQPGDITVPATATTGDVRGTITIPSSTLPTGGLYLVVSMYVQGAANDNDDVTLLYGVPQYTQVLMPPS